MHKITRRLCDYLETLTSSSKYGPAEFLLLHLRSGPFITMKNIIYPQIGNAAQHGIYLALSKKMSIDDAIKESQIFFKFSTKRIKNKNLDNCYNQIASIVKRGFLEISNLGFLKSYQKTIKFNKKSCNLIKLNKFKTQKNLKTKEVRLDFEIQPYSSNAKSFILELKVVWKGPNILSKKIQRQLKNYTNYSRKRCVVCFLIVKRFGKNNNFINTIPKFYEFSLK